MSDQYRSKSKSSRARALESLRAKLAKQSINWNTTASAIFHIERQESHGISFSDRANVLVGVTNLELALESAIRGYFVTLTTDEARAIFSAERAPLSSFGAKVKLGYALGLYEKLFSEDLKSIQLVRNYFAHNISYVDFSDPELISVSEFLNFSKYGMDEKNRKIWPGAYTPKGAFIETCKWMMLRLLLGAPKEEPPFKILDRDFYPHFPWPDTSQNKVE
tara:strand:- start:2204 stop:2863 length:660 start_codon:yes stop_codon:yes gene_type:complete